MAFQIKGTEVELGTTPVENIFIEQFLTSADGNYVKVYLLAYKYAASGKSNPKIDHIFLSKQLQLTLTDVINAWIYWEKMGVVKRVFPDGIPSDSESTEFDVVFLNLTELYLESVYKNKYEKSAPHRTSHSPIITNDNLVEAMGNPIFNDMFKELDEAFRRPLHSNERRKILEAIEMLGLDTSVVVKAFNIAAEEKKIRTVPYVLGILRNWHGMGVRTFDELEKMLEKTNSRHADYIKIKRAIGIPTSTVTPSEKNIIDRWLDEWKYPIDLIMKACDKSTGTANPSINYINGIIADWNDKNLRTLEEIEADEKKFKEERYNKYIQKEDGNKKSDKINTTTKFHNFDQREDKYSTEYLDSLWGKK